MYIDGSKIGHNCHDTVDVAIIGTGAGGAIVGKELAEAGFSVAFIEAGGYHPPASHKDFSGEAVERLYWNKSFTFALGTPGFPVLFGRCVGGTTTINSGTCFRAPSKIFASWQTDFGLHALSEATLAPHYDRIEKAIHVVETDFSVMSRSNTLIHEIFQKNNIPGYPLKRNVKDCKGCGMCCYGCTSGAKQSMDISYIPKAVDHGAKIYTHCQAVEFLKRKNEIIGVNARFLDTTHRASPHYLRIRAQRVILSAGTLISPILLKRNRLSRSPWLGKNLTVHPATKIYAEFDETINGWNGVPQAYYSDIFQDEGIMFEGIFVPPDIAAFMNPFTGKALADFIENYRHILSYGMMVEDSGSGSVMDLPLLGPTIYYNLSQQDTNKLKKGTTFLARLLIKEGAKRVIPMIRGPVTTLTSQADLAAFEAYPIRPKDAEIAAFHPLGTARIGTTPERGVVDINLKVHGTEGLYVCDGSIIPSPLGVNPQLTIMAFSDRLAHHLTTT